MKLSDTIKGVVIEKGKAKVWGSCKAKDIAKPKKDIFEELGIDRAW